jgi:hypothetical protein
VWAQRQRAHEEAVAAWREAMREWEADCARRAAESATRRWRRREEEEVEEEMRARRGAGAASKRARESDANPQTQHGARAHRGSAPKAAAGARGSKGE